VKYASRLSRLGSETAFELLAKAKVLEAKGKNIVHMEIGEPDFITPKNIINAAKKALDEGYTHYTGSAGDLHCRQRYIDYVNQRYGSNLTWENVVITPGAKPVLFHSALALIDPGDEVIYPNPGYPIYHSVINFLEAKPVPYILEEEHGFRFRVEELEKLVSDRTSVMIVNSPHNPTGGVLTYDDWKVITDLAEKHDFWILSDEIYSRIIYEGEHVGVMSFPELFERVVLLDGHSKTFAMTGWRLGYAVCNKELAGYITTLMTNANSCTATFTQRAGIEALHGDQSEVENMVREFNERRKLIVAGMNDLPGVKCHDPKGAFYVFPNFSSYGLKSKELQDRLLNEAGVACLAGTAFGSAGEGYMRFSYATSRENITEGLKRVREFLAAL